MAKTMKLIAKYTVICNQNDVNARIKSEPNTINNAYYYQNILRSLGAAIASARKENKRINKNKIIISILQ